MKTSVSLSLFEAKEGMPVLFSGGTEENIARISELGYDGVDLFVREPESEETIRAVELLKKYNLGVGVVMPAALAGEGLFLGDRDPAVRAECIRRIGQIIEFTAGVGGMVSVGLVRGNRYSDETLTEFNVRFTESCKKLLEIAEPLGVDLVIEPINRYEINTINSTQEGLEYIKESGLNLYLMLDTFHMNIEDVSVETSFVEALKWTKHIHFLDSNRQAPSLGHLDMANYYRLLDSIGYEGYLCLEALPKPTTEICAQAGADFFKLLKKEGL